MPISANASVSEIAKFDDLSLTAALLRLCPELEGELSRCWLPAPHRVAGGYCVAISLQRLDQLLSRVNLADVHPATLARAVRARQLSFLGGRLCAERAAAELGWDNAVIGRAERGAPRWPQGLLGSITHTDGFACAVVTKADTCQWIGIDSEWQVGAESMECILQLCCTPEEKHLWLGRQPNPLISTLIFSAKEAGYKALHGIVGRFVDFTEFETTELRWDEGVLVLTPIQQSDLVHVVGSLTVSFSVQDSTRPLVHTCATPRRRQGGRPPS